MPAVEEESVEASEELSVERAPPQMGKSAERPERVLFYCMNYAPEVAGVGRYTGEIAESLASRGAEVSVITTPAHYPGWSVQAPFTNARYASERRNGVWVFRCPLLLRKKMGGVWRLAAPLSFAITSAPAAFWHIVRHRPDIVVCIEPTLLVAPVAAIAAKLVKARMILHVQDLEIDAAFAVGHLAQHRWLKKLGEIFERWALRFFDRVVTISDTMAARLTLKGVPVTRISVVRNWVDLDHIYPLDRPSCYRAKFGYSREDFIVLYSGNIGAKQGLPVLLDAARRLSREPHIKFVVAGEGPAKDDLMRAYGDLASVRFLPFQPYDKLNEFMNLADLHVLPQEAGAADLVLPSKLGGMLASGKPIVVTADAGTELSFFLTDSVTISPPGDPAALADNLSKSTQMTDVRVKQRLSLSTRLSKTDGLNLFFKVIGVRQRGPATSPTGLESAM